MKFTIYEDYWCCASFNSRGRSRLKNKNGFLCCLGFCSLQLGASKNEILDRFSPKSVIFPNENENILIDKIDNLHIENSKLSMDAMDINDNPVLTLKERKERLIELFKKYQHEIEFVKGEMPQ